MSEDGAMAPLSNKALQICTGLEEMMMKKMMVMTGYNPKW